jgi:hypothetical protein
MSMALRVCRCVKSVHLFVHLKSQWNDEVTTNCYKFYPALVDMGFSVELFPFRSECVSITIISTPSVILFLMSYRG